MSPTSPQTLPLPSMDPQTCRKITDTVTDILKTADLNAVTEKHVRETAAVKLRFDLSDFPHKILVRQIIESFLLDDNAEFNNRHQLGSKPVDADFCRVICKLSQNSEVAVQCSAGETVVSIRDLYLKHGKQLPSRKCINLSPDQWSAFRKSVPAIEEAITKVESRLRSQVEKIHADADNSESMRHQNVRGARLEKTHPDANNSKNVHHQNGFRQVTAEPLPNFSTNHKPVVTETGKQVGNGSTMSSTIHRLVPTEIVRLNGKNYQQWADHMESYLNRLKVGYVLSVPCPSAVRVADWELPQTLTAIDKWINDDSICRQNIINTLCDNMFSHYSKKAGSARDLWEELKVIYLYEEHGAKISLVKKYIDFQIVDEKSIFDQVQELNFIADSLIAAGMYVEEKFHVNVIISKLPQSWKPYSIDLMKEEYLPVWMLMNQLKAEEEFCETGNNNRSDAPRSRHASPVFNHAKKLGPRGIPMKRHGVSMPNREGDREKRVKFCNVCKKNGHLPEQCWSRDSRSKEATVEGNGTATGNLVLERVVKDEPAE